MHIGIFDSGLGGLTVLHELRATLPHARFTYLGDVARLPYGTRSQKTVEKYALQCARFLETRQIDALVIACHTAAAAAETFLQETLGVPVFGVVEAGAKSASLETTNGRILVLATRSTVESETYPRRLARENPHLQVRQQACPLFVPLAEEGWRDHAITEEVAHLYLKSVDDFDFDTVLLGCTHYPLLTASLSRALAAIGRSRVKILDPAPYLATMMELRGYRSVHSSGTSPKIELFCTDTIQRGGLHALNHNLPPFQRVDL